MKIVLDTNVLVAAGWSAGTCREAFFRIIENEQCAIIVSPAIIEEYEAVVAYPKFNTERRTLLGQYLRTLLQVALVISPAPWPIQLPDPDDEKFLHTALAADVNALVTGNTRHYPASAYGAVRIVSPRALLNEI